ncbi:MAG: hypothetical protein JRJ84_09735, partial [Deltaproteobacteria bacterium]|nr:hypothetical protein [Deltaproteobacteria bacterium]
MSKSSYLLSLAGIVLIGALSSGCWGEEPPPVAEPVAEPEPEPEPEGVADTAAPSAAEEDAEALKRREFFEKWKEAGAPPEGQEEAVAAAPETEPEPEPPPAIATRPVAEPAPAPSPTTSPVTRPAPVPTPKPTTVRTAPTATRPAPTTATPRPEPAVSRPEPEPAVADADLPPSEDYLTACGDPISMKLSARNGELFEAEIRCLETVFGRAPTSLDRERVSVILLTNAYATGVQKDQELLLARHLKEVDGSNPEMNYRYALLLMAKGPEHSNTVMDLANVALTHRAVWSGELYDKRVYSLYKLRAAAAKYAFEEVKKAHAQDQSDEAERALYRAREDTKKYAREWYAFAKDTGQDTGAARELCMISAESSKWC